MFKKNQWVKIKSTGKIAKIVTIENNFYYLEVDGIMINRVFGESDLEPAPKTWDTLEVGDVIVSDIGNESKVLEVGENSFMRSGWNNFDNANDWYTSQEAKESGWKIKGATEEDITELTLEQIAKKFGKDVKKIKIKN